MTSLASNLPAPHSPELVLGNLWLNVEGYQVAIDDQDVYLSSVEFELLRALAFRPNKIVSFEELALQLFGSDERKAIRHLNVLVHRVRGKLSGLQPYIIKTVPRRGYGLVRPAAGLWPHSRAGP
ncbi:MAG: winged helix-turn-helix domain-containing protein [Dehalococcoidia bacterium]